MKHRKAAVEYLAQQIYKADIVSIEKLQDRAIEQFGATVTRPVDNWEAVTEEKKERYRNQARYLLEHFNISKKKPSVAAVTEAGVAKQ